MTRRVAILGPGHPFRGGIAYFTHHLSARLRDERELEVDYGVFERQYPKLLFPGAADRRPESSLAALPPPEFRWDPWSPRSIERAARRAASAEFVVIPWWTWFWAPTDLLLLRALRRAGARRILAVVHNFSDHEDSLPKRFLARRVLSRCDAFLAHSRAISEPLGRAFPDRTIGITPLPIHELPGDRNLPRDEARRTLALPSTGPLFLFFGFVRPYKGLPDLLAAWPAIRSATGGTLLIAGEAWGSARRVLDRAKALPGVVVHDRYIGDGEVAPYFRAADLVVLPYRSATGSGVVPIAGWFGRPVLATRVPGIEEVVLEGETGALVPPSDPKALAARAIELSGGGNLDRLGEGSRRNASEAFSWRRYVDTMLGIAAAPESRSGGTPKGAGAMTLASPPP